MAQVALSIAPKIKILFYDVATDFTSFKTVCLSQLSKEAFRFVSDGVLILNERIVDFPVFQTTLQSALSILKVANRSQVKIRDSQFALHGLESPVDATIEEFCDSENKFDFTMSFHSLQGDRIRWISMGESALESLLTNL